MSRLRHMHCTFSDISRYLIEEYNSRSNFFHFFGHVNIFRTFSIIFVKTVRQFYVKKILVKKDSIRKKKLIFSYKEEPNSKSMNFV